MNLNKFKTIEFSLHKIKVIVTQVKNIYNITLTLCR